MHESLIMNFNKLNPVRIAVFFGPVWMERLLDTMSFKDELPAFRMRQWQVIGLLFIEALSVCKIPAIIPYITDRKIFLPKVLDGSQIGMEEYEYLKDLIIPLGRAPHFSAQSGA